MQHFIQLEEMKKVVVTLLIIFFTIMSGSSQPKVEIAKQNIALIIIDIQNNYFPEGKMPLVEPKKAALNAKRIIESFRQKHLPVFHIQHISPIQGSPTNPPITHNQEINEIVIPIEGENVIIKHFPNSFKETSLLENLRDLKVNNLVICGMMTHMCVDATVRAAKDFGFDCIVIGDACATRDLTINGIQVKAAEVHNSFLAALASYYSKVLTTNQFLDLK